MHLMNIAMHTKSNFRNCRYQLKTIKDFNASISRIISLHNQRKLLSTASAVLFLFLPATKCLKVSNLLSTWLKILEIEAFKLFNTRPSILSEQIDIHFTLRLSETSL
jgi:hypothetical protein